MATKIFYNENRIIVDGHADTAEECRAITAMCDSMANNENFKTIVYEEGHAVFEQVSGGESELFVMKDYVLTSRYNEETGYSAAELANHGTIRARIEDLEYFQEECENYIIHNNLMRLTSLEQYISDKLEEKLARVKGVWVFNENISFPGHGIFQSLNFTTYYKSDATEPASCKSINIWYFHVRSGWGINYNNLYDLDYYQGSGWNSDTLRTIDFGSEPQACSDRFYDWLVKNATPAEAYEVETSKSLQERLDELEAKPEYELPYTASELVEKLSKL